MGALSELQTNGAFQDPSADSTAAQRLLDEQFDGAANVVLLADAREEHSMTPLWRLPVRPQLVD